MKPEDVTFVNTGDAAYGAILDERLVGVLYYAADEYDTEGMGEPEDARIWFFMATDDPLNPQGLDTPPLLPTMTPEEVVANVDEAMHAAFAWLDDRGRRLANLTTPDTAPGPRATGARG